MSTMPSDTPPLPHMATVPLDALLLPAPGFDSMFEVNVGDELFRGERQSAERIRRGVKKMAFDDAALHHDTGRKVHGVLH